MQKKAKKQNKTQKTVLENIKCYTMLGFVPQWAQSLLWKELWNLIFTDVMRPKPRLFLYYTATQYPGLMVQYHGS